MRGLEWECRKPAAGWGGRKHRGGRRIKENRAKSLFSVTDAGQKTLSKDFSVGQDPYCFTFGRIVQKEREREIEMEDKLLGPGGKMK